MTVMVPKEDLIAQSLETLTRSVNDGFARVDERFEEVDRKMDDGFARVDKGFEGVDKKFEAVDKKIDTGFAHVHTDIREVRGDLTFLHRLLLGAAVGIVLTLIGVIVQLALALNG